MKTAIRFVITFLMVGLAVLVAREFFQVEFKQLNYWNEHGVFFLIAISLFPRLTLLVTTLTWGGLWWWLGFFFSPRLLVAVLATTHYWYQNPVLVVLAWLVALGGEGSEKAIFLRQSNGFFKGGPQTRLSRGTRRGFKGAKWVDSTKD